jgi:hypothetical protein
MEQFTKRRFDHPSRVGVIMQTRLLVYGCTGKWFLPKIKRPLVIRVETERYLDWKAHIETVSDCMDKMRCVVLVNKKSNKAKKKALRDENLLGTVIPFWGWEDSMLAGEGDNGK